MTEFGLGIRDADGERMLVEHTYDWQGQTVTIEFLPPTIAEADELETLLEKDDLSVEEVQQPLDDFLERPSIPDGESWTLREFNAYIQGIYSWTMGAEGLGEDISDELEDVEGDAEGN